MVNPFWPSYEREKELAVENERFAATVTREQVVDAVLEFIGERWKPQLEWLIKKNLPDYERVRQSDHLWLGPGPQPENFKEFDNPDSPLTDSNSDLLSNLYLKRALINEWQGRTVVRRWMWDADGLQLLNLSEFHLEEEWGFLYTIFGFNISDDLTRIWFDTGEHPMSMRAWGLKVVKVEDGICLDDDPKAGFMIS